MRALKPLSVRRTARTTGNSGKPKRLTKALAFKGLISLFLVWCLCGYTCGGGEQCPDNIWGFCENPGMECEDGDGNCIQQVDPSECVCTVSGRPAIAMRGTFCADGFIEVPSEVNCTMVTDKPENYLRLYFHADDAPICGSSYSLPEVEGSFTLSLTEQTRGSVRWEISNSNLYVPSLGLCGAALGRTTVTLPSSGTINMATGEIDLSNPDDCVAISAWPFEFVATCLEGHTEFTHTEPDSCVDFHFKGRFVRGVLASLENLLTLPDEYEIFKVVPTPLGGDGQSRVVTVHYGLPVDGWVRLALYDVAGREVARLVDREEQAGYRSVRWDTQELRGGIYFCRLEASGVGRTRKMIVLGVGENR